MEFLSEKLSFPLEISWKGWAEKLITGNIPDGFQRASDAFSYSKKSIRSFDNVFDELSDDLFDAFFDAFLDDLYTVAHCENSTDWISMAGVFLVRNSIGNIIFIFKKI